MGEETKKYMILDAIGNPIKRLKDDEGSDDSYDYFTLRDVYRFAEKEIKNQDAISIVEIIQIERFGSGM